MSSIWSNAATQSGESPFATTGMAPSPGGGGATRFQSLLQSSGKQVSNEGRRIASPLASPAASPAAGPSATGSSGSSSSTGSAASGITSNDFLTLLVTEMQNQDPTAQTDPNEYINQLVQINSLEQLISINQNLATVLGAASSPTTPTTPTSPTVPAKGLKPVSQPPTTIGRLRHTPPASSIGSGLSSKPTSNASVKAAGSAGHGNLTPPQISPASRTVARALDGHRAPGLQSHGFRDIPTH